MQKSFLTRSLIVLFVLSMGLSKAHGSTYFSTLNAALLKYDETDTQTHYQNVRVQGLPNRSDVGIVGNRNYIDATFWPGKADYPLCILIAGLGGSSKSGSNMFLAQKLNKKNMSVLTLPSPFFWQASLSFISNVTPGITESDAKDLYTLIKQYLSILKTNGHTYSKVILMGASMGALESAYIWNIDQEAETKLISKTILINPPVDLMFGLKTLDDFAATSIAEDRKQTLKANAKQVIAARLLNNLNNPSYFIGLPQELGASEDEARFLIGDSMKDFLGGLVFATQQIEDMNVLTNPKDDANPDLRIKEAESWKLIDYFEKIILAKFFGQQPKNQAIEQLREQTGMKPLLPKIQQSKNIILFHNNDDFLLQPGDLEQLKAAFLERGHIYDQGGHLGNLGNSEVFGAIVNEALLP